VFALVLSQYLGAEAAEVALSSALGELKSGGLSAERVANVRAIINNLSFSKELKAMEQGSGDREAGGEAQTEREAEEARALGRVTRELAVVQVRGCLLGCVR